MFLQVVLIISAALTLGLQSFSAWALVGNPNAPKGGSFSVVLDAEPTTLNPLRYEDGYTPEVLGYGLETLVGRNIDTLAYEPALAEKWEESKDGKTITFTLRSNAKFQDGKPVTVEDVKFSFDAIFDDKLSSPIHRGLYENIDRAEIIGPQQIRFHIKKKYFLNFGAVASSIVILPKHIYSDPSKKMNKTFMGSGPYKLEKYDQGKIIILKKDPNWWGKDLPETKGYFHFDTITFRFTMDLNARLEMFKKGDFDHLNLTPEQFYKNATGPEWGTKLIKVKAKNDEPKGSGFVAFNLKKELFKDVRVRKALSLLLNRPFMIEKFLQNDYVAASGPWYPQNMYADKSLKPYAFDSKEAQKLLKEAGWEDTDKDGTLDKKINGVATKLKFSILNGGSVWDKYLTVYKEDLKKAGVDIDLKVVEWNALTKALDDRNFDTVAMAFGGTLESDPKQVWHSVSDVKGGSNFMGYNNPEVDELINVARTEFNVPKRVELLKKVYRIIANEYPCVFFWSPTTAYYAHSAKIGKAAPTYKYGIGKDTWWRVAP